MAKIEVKESTKKKLMSFRLKGESEDKVINRIYDMAVKEQLRGFLMSSEDATPISEAIAEAKKKWSN